MTDLFTDNGAAAPASYMDQLVGEGKQYKTVEELAKAAFFKEGHIRTIEEENAAIRAERDALKAVKTVVPSVPAVASDPVTTPPVVEPPLDLDTKIREVNERIQKETVTKTNLAEVERKMLETFGSQEKAAEVIRLKATELGVSPAFLQSTAAQSPAAFYTVIGLTAAPAVTPAASKSSVNTAAALSNAGNEPKQNTYKWFIKTYGNPGKWPASVHNQVHTAVFELGEDAFYA